MINKLYKLCNIYCEATKKDYMRDYMRRRYHDRRQKVIQELGGKCVSCGSQNNLQLDHKDRKKKTMRMADLHSVNDEQLQKELKNVQLLCKNCHDNKTREAWDFGAPKPRHGTYSMYQRHKCRCPKCVAAYRELYEKRRAAG